MMRKIIATLAAGAVALTLSACGGGAGGTNTAAAGGKNMRLSLNQTKEHPSFVALDNWGKALDKESGSKYKIQVYPNETLGKQAEAIQLVKAGTVDLAIVSGTQLENLNKDFTVLNLPNMFTSAEQQIKVVNDPAVTGDLFKSLEANNKIKVVGAFTQGARNIYLKSGPVKTKADLAGKKIRVQESEMMLAMIRAMGASPTPMAYGEVYTALQSGVIDGAENNEVSYYTVKHFEVAKFYSYTKHLVGVDYLIMNADLYNKLSAADKAAFDKTWKAAYTEHLQLWNKSTQDAITKAKAGGAQFSEVPADVFAADLDKLATQFVTTDSAKKLYDAVKAAGK